MTPTAPAGILLVDDEQDLTQTCERLLRREGYRVTSVGSREAGVSFLQSNPAALVIADLRLPDGDGLDVVRAARGKPVPAIVITGFPSEPGRQAAMAASASAYLSKPFAAAQLVSLVNAMLGVPEGRTLRDGR